MKQSHRKHDIVELVKGLDISPTMFKNATEKYENVAKYLQEHGIDCDVYPLGSFSLGTVVRPYRNMKDAEYDLDFIVCLKVSIEDYGVNAKDTKWSVRNTLVESDVYKRIMSDKEWEKCWTLAYAAIDDIDFNMDIIPAVMITGDGRMKLLSAGLNPLFSNDIIAITNKKNADRYEWLISNPKGYTKWFRSINEPYLAHNREARLNDIMQSSNGYFSSIEEIPMELERSALQRVIQILKRHRDIYFSKLKKEEQSFAPISAIITTLVTKIAAENSPNMDVHDLLTTVVSELSIYSKKSNLSSMEFSRIYGARKLIDRIDGEWKIMNPVNPEDNLADGWNDNPAKAKAFFMWINQVVMDFIESMDVDDERFAAVLGNAFGQAYFKHSGVGMRYNRKPTPIINKPSQWGEKI